jgi:16S rRNA (uracil1498-N3)-methyltransferase
MRRFYIDPEKIDANELVITGSDAYHISTVMRMSEGDRIFLTDGTGRAFEARIEFMKEQNVGVVIEKKLSPSNESPLEMIVAQGFLKDKKMDDLIRPLTELGMTRWVPTLTRRTVARPDSGRMKKRIQRWQSIAIEAIKQCGRTVVPSIEPLMDFSEVLDYFSNADKKLFFWEQANQPLLNKSFKKPASVLILLGPEGGFTNQEAGMAMDKGCIAVSLGCRILRAQTAAVCSCALTQYLFGDLQKSP